ncbi:MAG: hypothetical protein E7418_02400 [Ruminococcaceae bacterium]|nr:hypothetical protein [Oscillospiraceae bacterium]
MIHYKKYEKVGVIMKKGFKILAATVAAMLLLSAGMSAMAATYNTVTEYAVVGTTETVTVTTTVSGLGADEEVAYLVYADKDDAGDVDDAEIIYIDQINSAEVNNEGDLVFGFSADYSVLKNGTAEVKVGAQSSAVTAGAVSNVVVENKTINFSAVNGTVYVDSDDETSTTTKLDEITFYLIPNAGYHGGVTVAKNKVDVATDVIAYTYTAEGLEDGDTFVFTFNEVAEDADPVANIATSSVAKEGYTPNKFETNTSDTNKRQFTLFGTATNSADFGILVSDATFAAPRTKAELEALTGVIKIKAAGANGAGKFAISAYEVKTGENFTTALKGDDESKIYACVYAVNGDNVATSAVAAYALDAQ